MGTRPESGGIGEAAWPVATLADALASIAATNYGLPGQPVAAAAAQVTDETLSSYVEELARRAGLHADQTFASLEELEMLLTHGAPLLLKLSSLGDKSLIVVVGCRRGVILALAPDGSIRHLSLAQMVATIRAPFQEPLEPSVHALLDRLQLRGAGRQRARATMLRDRLAAVRFRSCWLLRLPADATITREIGEARVAMRLATLVGTYAAQFMCFVGSWWLLGRAIVGDSESRGWLLGWLLLLISVIPLRLLVTWEQGLLTLRVGSWLRRRMLAGAFRVDRHQLRRKGAGELFGAVLEAAALDAMALTGGLSAAFALLEILGAGVVMSFGASAWPTFVLLLWTVMAGGLAWAYLLGRRAWTAQRFSMAHSLLESMMGHRTRIAQQPMQQEHVAEDAGLDAALVLGQRMDRIAVWLSAVMPRGWLVVALATLVPAVAFGATPSALAVSVGGVLLAYRALHRLAAGCTHLTGAVIAGQAAQALVVAAARHTAPTPLTEFALHRSTDRGPESVLQARDLVFRYRPQGDPVIAGATLSLERGAHYLLEGPSGSGKTTFAALLAGLERPDSGLVLSGGLDRALIGDTGWRKRILMAPQPHDNYLVGASLAFNLLMGRRWPAEAQDLADADAVCRELGLGDLLDRLPGGLDQIVGETGWQLSQGERLRVFLARALLQRPELLILDESFGALDPENVDRALRTVTTRAEAVLAIAHA